MVCISHSLIVRSFSGPMPSEKRVAREREKILMALDKAGMQVAHGKEGSETLVYGDPCHAVMAYAHSCITSPPNPDPHLESHSLTIPLPPASVHISPSVPIPTPCPNLPLSVPLAFPP